MHHYFRRLFLSALAGGILYAILHALAWGLRAWQAID